MIILASNKVLSGWNEANERLAERERSLRSTVEGLACHEASLRRRMNASGEQRRAVGEMLLRASVHLRCCKGEYLDKQALTSYCAAARAHLQAHANGFGVVASELGRKSGERRDRKQVHESKTANPAAALTLWVLAHLRKHPCTCCFCKNRPIPPSAPETTSNSLRFRDLSPQTLNFERVNSLQRDPRDEVRRLAASKIPHPRAPPWYAMLVRLCEWTLFRVIPVPSETSLVEDGEGVLSFLCKWESCLFTGNRSPDAEIRAGVARLRSAVNPDHVCVCV